MTRMNRVVTQAFLLCTLIGVVSFFAVYAHAQQQNTFSEAEGTRIINLGANITNRIEATEARLLQIADRMERRANKTELSADASVAVAEHIGFARAEIARSKRLLTDIDTNMAGTATAEKPADHWRWVRSLFLDSKGALRNARDRMVAAYTILENPSEFSAPGAPLESPATQVPETVVATSSVATTSEETVN